MPDLRTIRRHLGLTQAQLATELGDPLPPPERLLSPSSSLYPARISDPIFIARHLVPPRLAQPDRLCPHRRDHQRVVSRPDPRIPRVQHRMPALARGLAAPLRP